MNVAFLRQSLRLSSRRIALALSGGQDSMYLLQRMSAELQNSGLHCQAITVDHGIRPTSAAEASRVVELTQSVQQYRSFLSRHVVLQQIVHHCDSSSEIQKDRRHWSEENARDFRMGCIEQYCAERNIVDVFFAHHSRDQAETVLFRLARSSGLAGLQGMRDDQKFGRIRLVRPLLSVNKQLEVDNESELLGIPHVADPSNTQDSYARNRMRRDWNRDVEGALLTISSLVKSTLSGLSEREVIQAFRASCHLNVSGGSVVFSKGLWRALTPTEQLLEMSRIIKSLQSRHFRSRFIHRLVAESNSVKERHCFWSGGIALAVWPEGIIVQRRSTTATAVATATTKHL
ncbi:mitochondrial tRNAIle lysidine synthetase [Andalucia godoyi]|uniref:tRNA(Ile)-lysidine synthetase n=1 Tax=Andalucia godoyi TaxID=505711 RepID=A0A8K0AHF6_ANDGO|nr:mitochondrial tRNAIle lysidine synthetase [Andalucia godoyi]|eukprot:ANDGO_04963.mRNA.1 mitochondrial tRNAIle lysidine synthetase